MEYIYHTTVCSMLQALVAGAVWGVYYDVFRMLRRLIGFSRVSIALQDVFFWLTSVVGRIFEIVRTCVMSGMAKIYLTLKSNR